jgi:hypothetical protein
MFTPVETSVGALLLCISSTAYKLSLDQNLGVSGRLGNICKGSISDENATILGMVLAAVLVGWVAPGLVPDYSGGAHFSSAREVATGALVGWGTLVRFFSLPHVEQNADSFLARMQKDAPQDICLLGFQRDHGGH